MPNDNDTELLVKRLLLPMFLFLILPLTSVAEWTFLAGPEGGNVTGLSQASDGTLYAQTANAGLFRSTDGGESWSITSLQPWQPLDVQEGPNGRMYAFIYPDGYVYSDDQFDSFTLVGVTNEEMRFSSRFRVTPNGTLIGTGTNQFGSGVALYRSVDDGMNWTQVLGLGVTGAGVRGFHVTDSGTIIAIVANAGIYRSVDDGETFAEVMSDVEIGNEMGGIVEAPNGEIIAASSLHFWHSENDGESWRIGAAYPTAMRTFVSPGDGNIYQFNFDYDLFRSPNNGQSWELIQENMALVNGMVAVDGSLLFNLGQEGIVRSDDGGMSWTSSSTGLHARAVDWLNTDEDGTLYARSIDGHLVRYHDDEGWSWIDPAGLGEWDQIIAAGLAGDGTLYAVDGSHSLLYHTSDRGESWSTISTDLDLEEYDRIIIDDEGTIYIVADDVFISTDGGSHFTMPEADFFSMIDFFPFENGDYAASDMGALWHFDVDSGEWLEFLGDDVSFGGTELIYDPATDRLITGGRDRLLVSNDHGESWETLGNPILPDNPGLIVDGVGRNAEGHLHVAARWIHNRVQVRGSYVSEDEGITWQEQVELADGRLNTFRLGNDGEFYLATAAGVLREGVPVSSLGEESTTVLPAAITLSPNWPNPFNPSTSIRFTLASTNRVTLTVTDMLGRQVMLAQQGVLTAGTHTVPFDGSDLASGTYIYTVQADRNAVSGKMQLVK